MFHFPNSQFQTVLSFLSIFSGILRGLTYNRCLNSAEFGSHRSHKFPVSRTSSEKLCDFIGYNFKSSTSQVGLNKNRIKVLHTSFAPMSANRPLALRGHVTNASFKQ